MTHRLPRQIVSLASIAFAAMLALTGVVMSQPHTAEAAGVVWSTDFESGNLNAWSAGGGGGMFNSGNGNVTVTTERAHSGSRSAKMTINATGSDTGARLHRWAEPDSMKGAYYSAWYYFPQRVSVQGGWWNILQFKSRTSSRNDPFWILYVGNRSDGSMYVYLRDWIHKRSYQQTVANLPVGKWVHLEVYYEEASSNSGRVTVWQDGQQLFDLRNVQTGYSGGRLTWGVTNYASRLSPSQATIYVDDCVIATERQGPGNAPAPNPPGDPKPTPQPTPNPGNPTPTPQPSGRLTWTSPTNGLTITGSGTLKVTAPSGTAGVWFWRDNWVWLGSDWNGSDGWNLPADTRNWGRGQHRLIARAFDANDRQIGESIITVTVR